MSKPFDLQGPRWTLPAEGGNEDSILSIGFDKFGAVVFDAEDLRSLFGANGFWWASAAVNAADPDYEALADRLIVHGSDAKAIASCKALCIQVSGPREKLRLRDARKALDPFRNLAASDVRIVFSTGWCEHGGRISVAFA